MGAILAKIKKSRPAETVSAPEVAPEATLEIESTVDLSEVPEPEDDGTVDLSPAPDPLPGVGFPESLAEEVEPEPVPQPEPEQEQATEPPPVSPVAAVSMSPTDSVDVYSAACLAVAAQPDSPFFKLAAEAETAARTSYAVQPVALDPLLLAQIALALYKLYQGCLSEKAIKRRVNAAVSGNDIMRRRLVSRISETLPDQVQGHTRDRLSEEILLSSARMTHNEWVACATYASDRV